MSFRSSIRIQKKQNKSKMMHLGLLKSDERRKQPWLGSYWFTEATAEEREEYIRQYHLETEQMQRANPKLRLV